MGSLVGGMLEGLQGAACSYLTGTPDWQRNWRRLLMAPAMREYNDFLVRAMCNRPPEPTDYPPPPFTGGQCPIEYDVDYSIHTRRRSCKTGKVASDFGPQTFQTRKIYGPIRIEQHRIPHCGGNSRGAGLMVYGYDSGGSPAELSYRASVPSTSLNYIEEVSSSFSVSPTGGGSDECGDPDFDPGDYSPTNINLDLDVNYGPTNNFNVTIPVIIAPVYIAFDGSVNVPVTFDISPEISLEGTWTLFPDAKLELNFPSPTEEPPGSTGDDDPPPEDPGKDDPGGGSEDDPDAPGKPDPEEPEEPEERIHFLICRAVVNPEARPSTINQNVAPSLYVPRLGSARFGTTVDGVTFWTSDIDIKGLNSIIECPIPWGATRFAVDAAPGVALNYSPVSTDPQTWPQYLQIGTTYTNDRR